MAEKMVFPIGFDLEAAVKSAGDAWDKKYAKRLEDLIAKRPINVKLKFDTKKLDDLDAVKKRLAELKIEPITPATKAAIKELAAELKTLAKALEAVEKYSRVSTRGAVDASKVRVNEERAKAQAALAAQRAARAEYNLAAARDKDALAATRGTKATQNLSREYKAQDGYISRLIKRLAVYAGYRQITGFLDNVRKVTAEFELQRVSLGAIIQDQQRANALFSEIKSFALKSPVSILDLTKYTKQLAAYKIGVDELFETTKKLTDVSVGLGVSMDRVVLAYGQTRATGYLRASEIRQFTEMGVPIVEELAKKLSQMNGELVTAAQVMDMVSKRAISFELVKEVFDDMTSAGGMFYNMQEKQGNTLFGLWAKLGDAASVMYDEIGNTDTVNSAMKGTISLLTDLMKNWREVGRAMGTAGVGFAALWATKKVKGWQSGIDEARIAASKKVQAAQSALNAEIIKGTKETVIYNGMSVEQTRVEYLRALALRNAAAAQLKAANATTLWSKAWNKLKAAFLGNWVTLLIAGLAAVAMHIYNAHEKANRLKNSLKEIAEESGIEQMKSVRNFESLANAAVNAADGSKRQKDALDELNRTYKDIIPQERLTIENLRAMKGNYDSLTQSIKDYVTEQMKQKQINAVVEQTGKTILDEQRKINKFLSKKGFSDEQIGHFWDEYETLARNSTKSVEQLFKESWNRIGGSEKDLAKLSNLYRIHGGDMVKTEAMLSNITNAFRTQEHQIARIEAQWNKNYAALGRYGNEYEKLSNNIKENPISAGGSPDVDEDKTPYLFKQQRLNLEILQAMIPTLKKIMSDAGVAWQDGWANMVTTIDNAQPQIITSIDFGAISKYLNENIGVLTDEQRKAVWKIRDMYDEIVPSNRTTVTLRAKLQEISTQTGVSMEVLSRHLINAGESWEDYSKRVRDAIKGYETQIEEMRKVNEAASDGNILRITYTDEEIKKTGEYAEALKLLLPFLQALTNKTRTSTSDPRLGILQEMVSTLKQVNKEYDELVKKQGADKAFANTFRTYQDTFKRMSELSKKYKFGLPDFDVPTNANELKQYLNIIRQTMAKLPKSDKAVLDLQVDIDKIDMDDLQKKLDAKLKDLSDKISRTKTAKEFYDKILSQTGDAEIAATLTMNVYGEGGEDLFNNTVKLLQEYFSGVEVDLPINFDTQQIDYRALRKIWEADKALPADMRKIPEAYDSAIKQMLDSADTANQKMIEGWLKATEKAKSYSDKLLDLARTTQTEINKITLKKGEAETRIAELLGLGDLDADQQKELNSLRNFLAIADGLIDDFKAKQAKEQTSLAYEAFKDSPMYVQLFDDLGSASTTMLNAMRDRLVSLKDEWKNLDPTQLKEMQQRLREIDEQLTSRNPFKKLVAALKEYRKLRTKGDDLGSKSSAEADEKLLEATDKRIEAEERYKAILADVNATKEQKAQAKADFDQAESDEKAAQKAKEVWQDVSITIGSATDTILGGLGAIGDIANGVADIMEAVGADEEDVTYWRTIGSSISEITAGLQDVVQSVMKGDLMGVITGIITAIPKIFVGFVNIFNAGRIRRANKEIKRQQELLDQLQYTYSRLEKAAEKVFGADYLRNYNQQLRNLQAQVSATQRQLEAEQSKGKKADKDKIKEYTESIRDLKDEIADMQGKLSEQMLGSDLASKARDMAKAWLDAYKEIGRAGAETTKAMKEQFQDMIENMVVEGALAAVMQKALQPMFDMIDSMNEQDFYSESFWKKVAETAQQGAEDADKGAQTLMKFLEQAGLSIKDINTEYTGIKRDIAGASEETMSNVAVIGNNLMYYVSPIPGIAANVAVMRQIMENGNAGATTSTTAAGWTDWQQQAMDHYAAIQRNTADTVVECRRAAQAAENAVSQLQRVISTKGGTHGFNVWLKS